LKNKKDHKQLGWFDKPETETNSELSDRSFSLSGSEIEDSDGEDFIEPSNESDRSIRRLRWLKPEFHPDYKISQAKKGE
jgi:hypothetical protein